jgi:hypothetical protein
VELPIAPESITGFAIGFLLANTSPPLGNPPYSLNPSGISKEAFLSPKVSSLPLSGW